MIGLIAAFAVAERPAIIPSGIAIADPMRNPKNTVLMDVQIC
jgi:hypothetical protein